MRYITLSLIGLFLLVPMARAQTVDAPIRHLTLQERISEDFSPRMVKVIQCESNFNPDAIGHNPNGSTDISTFQINSSWIPTAQKMGLNLYDKEDNYTFALWLYKTSGIKNWVCDKKV